MPKLSLWFLCAFLLLAPALSAQERGNVSGGARKQATAIRVTDGAIHVDGRLNEEAWQRVPAITDFVQKEPVEGVPPTEQMEVRFAFDGSALYVGARMYSREPSAIQAPMGRRDDVEAQSEYIFVSLDTFLDRRTAYTFGVTAFGVRIDRFHRQDDEETFDAGFDPVWEAETVIDEQGWTAELEIPFSQLRFTNQTAQVWGLNVRRFTPTLEEQDDWVLVPRTERAWASRFGDLRGIENLRPPRRLELLPFVVGSSAVNSERNPGNPFDSGFNPAGRVGLDMKMGLGPSLTLDATVNPDFGQIEADPAEVNLTAVPTRFTEKRPFFIEGSQLLNIAHPNFFYSRRIGARPLGPATADYVDYPSASTILGAAKISGRIRPRTSLGVLTAVTNEEFASLASVGAPGTSKIRIAPLATFGLARIQQEFGRTGSFVSGMVVAQHRSLGKDDPLASLLSRNSLALSGDTLLRFKGGEYELKAAGGSSFVSGEPGALDRIQRGSAHYAQRPDKDYGQIDSTRTSLTGGSVQLSFDRVSGRHWLWGLVTNIDSVFFETNDISLLNAADGLQPRAKLSYRETRPNRIFRNYSIGITSVNEWNWGGDRQQASLRAEANVTWANFWTTSFTLRNDLTTSSASLTRGGPLMGTPQLRLYTTTFGNRPTAQTRWSGTLTFGGNEDGGSTRRVKGDFAFRFGPRWQLSVAPTYEYLIDTQQYVTTMTTGGRPETYGSRYIFAEIERSTFSTQFRTNFTLRPDLTVDLYAEPFAASGYYDDFGELLAAGSRQRLAYGTAPGTTFQPQSDGRLLASIGDATFALANPDFNVRSFRSTLVLRYEWRLGSTLYVVWQQDKHAQDPIGAPVGVDDVFRSVGAPGTNIFLVKASFWLPVR